MTPDTAWPLVDNQPPGAAALAAGRPVVALESTIIPPGMPGPDNDRMAANVERLVITGTSAINGAGNDLGNRITGNSAANLL